MLAGVHLNENFPSTKVPKCQISAGKAVSKAPHSSFLPLTPPEIQHFRHFPLVGQLPRRRELLRATWDPFNPTTFTSLHEEVLKT